MTLEHKKIKLSAYKTAATVRLSAQPVAKNVKLPVYREAASIKTDLTINNPVPADVFPYTFPMTFE